MFRTEVWLVSTLFCVGVIAGMVAVWPGRNNPDIASSSESHEPEKISDSGFDLLQSSPPTILGADELQVSQQASQDDSESLQEARMYLMAGGYDRAAKHLRKQLEQVSLRSPGRAANKFVWLGIAEELAGRKDAAELAYSTALRGQLEETPRSVAVAGLARILLAQQRYNETLSLLSDVFLQSDVWAPNDSWIQAESRWLLATTMRDMALNSPEFIEAKHPLYFLDPAFDLENVIDLLVEKPIEPLATDSTKDPEQPTPVPTHDEPGIAPPKPQGVFAVQLPNNQMDLIALDIHLETQPIFAITQQVVAVAEVKLEVDPSARERMTGRSKAVRTSGQNAAVFLDVLLAPLDLEWKQEGDTVRVFESSAKDKSGFQLTVASRLYFQFTILNQADNRQEFVKLNLGNIASLKGDYDSASAAYQGAIQAGANGELLSRHLANHAMLNRALGRNERAVSDLYQAIDNSYDQQLHGELWSQLAEIALELGRIDEAITAGTRAIRLQGNDASVGRGAIALASAYLVKNNPWAANQAIFESQSALKNSSMVDVARFLGSYSRFLGSRSDFAKKRETTRLLESLAVLNDRDSIPPAAGWLAARAWSEFGMDDDCLVAITKSLATASDNFWISRLSWNLAKIHERAHRNTEAFAILEQMANDSTDESGQRARIELARMQLEAGDPAKCMETLQHLFAATANEAEKRDALKVMGDAYTVSGKPYAAALCYAGMLPEANVIESVPAEPGVSSINTNSSTSSNNH